MSLCMYVLRSGTHRYSTLKTLHMTPGCEKNQSLSSVTREHFHLLLHFHRHSVMACQHQRLYLYSRWWCNLSLSTINQLSFENTTFSFRLWKDERIMFFIKKNTWLVGELHSEMQINHVSKDSDFRKLVKFEVMLLPENWIHVSSG